MLRRSFFVLLTLLTSTAFCANSYAQSQDYDVRPNAAQVTGDALTQAFNGTTHDGAYNFDALGRPGALYTERHFSNGGISYTEQGQTIKGQWTVTPRDTICYVYEGGIISGGCFRVYQLGSCYYFYSANRIERENEIDEDYWTARSVKQGERATCEDMIS